MAVYKINYGAENASPTSYYVQQKSNMISKINSKELNIGKMKKLQDFLQKIFYLNESDKDLDPDQIFKTAADEFNKRFAKFNFDRRTSTAVSKFKGQIDFATADTLEKELKKLTALVQKDVSLSSLSDAINKIENLIKTNAQGDALKEFNSIIGKIFYGDKTAFGDAFEIPLAVIAQMLDQQADGMVDSLDQYFIGGQKSSTQIDISHFSKKDQEKLMQIYSNYKIPTGGKSYLELKGATKDKIDVIMHFDGLNLGISAKSYYDPSQHITILAGTGLDVPVLNLTFTNFVNEYITNLYYNSNNLSKSHEALRLTILYMSLTGYGTGQINPANVMVFNAKKDKKIYVTSLSHLAKYVESNNRWNDVKFQENLNGGEIPDKQIAYNAMKQNYSVVDIIAAMHQQKLQVSLKGSVVKKASQSSESISL